MSEAGYILDKTPDRKFITEFTGDSLLTREDFAAIIPDNPNWMLWSGSSYAGQNYISGDWYVLDSAAPSLNYVKSPTLYNYENSQEDMHFSFTTKLDGTTVNQDLQFQVSPASDIATSLNFKAIGPTADLGMGVYKNTTYDGDLLVDLSEELKWDIYLIGSIYTIYVNGVLVYTIDGYVSGGNNIAWMQIGWLGNQSTDFWVKDCRMGFELSFIEGYNLLKSTDSAVTCSQQTAAFPIDNLFDSIPNRPTVFDSSEIEITMTADNKVNVADGRYEFTTLAILGHNFSPQAIIKLSYKNVAGGAPDAVVYLPWKVREIIFTSSVALSYKYVILEVIDPLNTTNLMIGELLLGTPKYFSQCFFWGCDVAIDNNNITQRTDFYAKWNYHLSKIKSVNGIDFGKIKDDTVSELFDLFEASDGSRWPVLFFWDTRSADRGIIYGTLQDELKNKLTFLDVNDVGKMKIIGLPYARAIEDDL